MALSPPAVPGMPFDEVDTPALVVDLDAFERNLARMAEDAAAAAGVALRPHAKTHKSPIIARRQIALGAVGVCCQKVSEAEILVEGGVGDVLVTNEVIGRPKIERLALLARRARIGVCVDDPDAAGELSAAAVRFGAEVEALVEVDVGAGRCGVPPGRPAVELAKRIAGLPGLRFGGLQAYHGAAQHLRRESERAAAIESAAAAVRETLEALEAAGIACPRVTGGGTGTWRHEAASRLWTEVQPGSYVFMDADYARNLDAGGKPISEFEHALFVLATVMSRPTPTRAVVDAGLKAVAVDSGPPVPRGRPNLAWRGISDEHGVLVAEGSARAPDLGERLLLVPGHCDPTVNLHDWYVAVRGMGWEGAFVEAVWPVAARGAVF